MRVEKLGIKVYGKEKKKGKIVIVIRRKNGVEWVIEVIEKDWGIGKMRLWGERKEL